jgi:hypothetical protein
MLLNAHRLYLLQKGNNPNQAAINHWHWHEGSKQSKRTFFEKLCISKRILYLSNKQLTEQVQVDFDGQPHHSLAPAVRLPSHAAQASA